MKPLIGSRLPPQRIEHSREPFPGTPWAEERVLTPWELVFSLVAIVATVAILMLPLWLE